MTSLETIEAIARVRGMSLLWRYEHGRVTCRTYQHRFVRPIFASSRGDTLKEKIEDAARGACSYWAYRGKEGLSADWSGV